MFDIFNHSWQFLQFLTTLTLFMLFLTIWRKKLKIFDHFLTILTIFFTTFDHFLTKFLSRHFDQKCLLIYSKSILSKKVFSKIFFQNFHFWPFLAIFWLFLTIFEFFGSKNEKKNLPKFWKYFFNFLPLLKNHPVKIRKWQKQ